MNSTNCPRWLDPCTFCLVVIIGLGVRSAHGQITSGRAPAGTLGHELYYEIQGVGDPVVLIHGLTLDLRMWDAQVAVLAEHYRVIRYDVIGHGQSSGLSASLPNGSVRDWDYLGELLDQLDVEKAHLVGLSMGGGIAINFALAYPDRVQTLTPMDSRISGYNVASELGDRFNQYINVSSTKGVQAALPLWANDPLFAPANSQPAVREQLEQMVIEDHGALGAGAYFQWPNPQKIANPSPSALSRLNQIAVPTLAIVGELDVVDFQLQANEIVGRVPNSTKLVVPAAGHMSNMENPEFVNAALLEFFAAHPITPPPLSPADFNADGVVDGLDLARWSEGFGVNGGSDADGDGDTDGDDFLLWQRHLGSSAAPPTQAVPEPSSVTLLGLLCTCACLSRLRNRPEWNESKATVAMKVDPASVINHASAQVIAKGAAPLMSSMRPFVLVVCGLVAFPGSGLADVFRWQGGTLVSIPGTEGVTPGPGVQLTGLDLERAELRDVNLTGANFAQSRLARADMTRSILTGGNLTRADLTSANLWLTTLAGADFTDAVVTDTNLSRATEGGFTRDQLYSTSSYRAKNLQYIRLESNLMNGWDFSGQNLSGSVLSRSSLGGANLAGSDLTGANLHNAWLRTTILTDARIRGASFSGTAAIQMTSGQLYSTASYKDRNLGETRFQRLDLAGWDFSGQNLARGSFYGSTLTSASFSGADLTENYFGDSELHGADFSGAIVTRAGFTRATLHGFTREQLYSTSSYHSKNLTGVGFQQNDFSGWDFSDQDLRGTDLAHCTLSGSNFAGAQIAGAYFREAQGFTHEQLYSTASHAMKNLQGTDLSGLDLSGWNLSGQRLDNARLHQSSLRGADLADAIIVGADLGSASGFTSEQLYSTASYRHGDLQGVDFSSLGLEGWDFSGQNLTKTNFIHSSLTGANFGGARVAGAMFYGANTGGLTKEQLYSTASYEEKELSGIGLVDHDLTDWNFRGQNLTSAVLDSAILAGADLSGAIVSGVQFGNTTSRGLTQDQLYSTGSYQLKNLRGIGLQGNELNGWDLRGQLLTDGELGDLAGAILIGADARGSNHLPIQPTANTKNFINGAGILEGLLLGDEDRLVIRDHDGGLLTPYGELPPTPITVLEQATVNGGGIQFQFDADAWNSRISFEPGILVRFRGSLELAFADDVDVAAQVGRTFALFDWTGVSPTGRFSVESRFEWDLAKLYTTGEVTLLTVPEPSLASLLAIAAITAQVRRRASLGAPRTSH